MNEIITMDVSNVPLDVLYYYCTENDLRIIINKDRSCELVIMELIYL